MWIEGNILHSRSTRFWRAGTAAARFSLGNSPLRPLQLMKKDGDRVTLSLRTHV